MPLRIGENFAGYRLLRLLGSGGMGEVYLVQHPRLPRQDALKVLRPDVSSDTSFRERFIREADLAAGLRHPHIVGIHDRGEDDGRLWISMDYIDGTDTAQLMRQRYPAGMPVELAIPVISAVASALDYAHKKGRTPGAIRRQCSPPTRECESRSRRRCSSARSSRLA